MDDSLLKPEPAAGEPEHDRDRDGRPKPILGDGWSVWSEDSGVEAGVIPPPDVPSVAVIRISTGSSPGGLSRTLDPDAGTTSAACLWVLVRKGSTGLRLEGDGVYLKIEAAGAGGWERLCLKRPQESARYVVRVELDSDSEALIAPAGCARETEVNGAVSIPPAVKHGVVTGRVTRGDTPIRWGRVILAARRLRGVIALGDAVPSVDGRYRIAYDWAGDTRPSLSVTLVDDHGEGLGHRELGPTHADEGRVDFDLETRGRTDEPELVRLIRAVRPLLDGLLPGDLDVADVEHLATATGQERPRLHSLIRASQLANQSNASTAVLYALLRDDRWAQRLETGRWSDTAVRDAVDEAIRGGVIPQEVAGDVAEAITRLRDWSVERVLNDEPTRSLWSVAVPDEPTRRSLLTKYLSAGDESVWETLSAQDDAEDLRYALTLAPLVEHDLNLVTELFRRRRASESVGVHDLAGWEAGQWEELVAAAAGNGGPAAADPRPQPGSGGTARTSRLARAFEQAFPVQAFNQRVLRHDGFGSPAVAGFLRDHPIVDLGKDDVDRLATGQHGSSGASEPARAHPDVKMVQRLYRVSPSYDHVAALHAAGLGSARAITRVGRSEFVRRYASALSGEAGATTVFDRASRISLAATALYADHGPAAKAVLPRVLKATGHTDPTDWEELFGDQLSFAGVEDCRSVFSPAAYLTDLFNFLDHVPSGAGSGLDDLLSRRPDLQWLALSCANTNVSVRYIDLVNELLESTVVAHAAAPVWLEGYPDAVAGALPAGAAPTVGDEGWQWVIDPAQPKSAILAAHESPAAAGQHQHGFTGAVATMVIAPGDLLVSWVYLDPANPPDEIMIEWTVGADAEHRAYWTDLGDQDAPGIVAGIDGTASRWPMGPLPDLGRWMRLVVPGSAVGLEGTQVTGMSFFAYTDAGADSANPNKGGAWWGSARSVANASPVETEGASDLLGTTPQVITTAGYAPLETAVYPQQLLPFDLGIKTARTVLDHLSVPRQRVMGALYSGAHPAALIDLEISTELLGLSPAERAILGGTDGYAEPEHWGMTVDNANPNQWFKDLMVATEFLHRSGLSLDEMQTVPGAIFSYGFGLDFADPNDSSTLTVVGVGEQSLGYIRRFLRLWRKLGWPHGDLERIIHNVGPKDPTGGWPAILDPLMITLALMARLQAMIGMAPVTTMSLWTPVLDGKGFVDVKNYPPDGPLTASQSPYARLFLTSATGPPNAAFRLSAGEDELADPNQAIDSQSADVLAALGISASDLDLLATSSFTGLPTDPAGTTTLKLNLGNLSALYRSTALAKAMGLSASEFLTLREITRIDPFDAAGLRARQPEIDKSADASPILAAQANTVLFVEALDDIRAAGISLAQLSYVLAHASTPGDPVTPTEQQVGAVLADLQSVLVPVVDAHQAAPDPTGQLTLSELGALPGLAGADAAVEALNGTGVTTQKLAAGPEDIQALSAGELSYDADSGELTFALGAMTSTQRRDLGGPSDDAAYKAAVDGIFAASRQPISTLLSDLGLNQFTVEGLIDNLSDPAARFAALLPSIAGVVREQLGQLLVVNKISTAIGLEADLCTQLLEEWLHVNDAAGSSTTALAVLLTLGAGGDIDAAARDGLVKCFQVSRLISSFGLTRAEVTHAFTVGRKHGWLDLDALPVAPGTADFAGWQQLAHYVQLRAKLGDTAGVLIDVFATADAYTGDPAAGLAAALEQVSAAFGWQVSAVTDAAAALGLSYPASFVNQDGISRLSELSDVAAAVGAKVGWLKAVATNPLAAQAGLAAWPLLAAHYDPGTWTSVGATLQDTLRETRRDALVGYLQANPSGFGITDPAIDSDRMLELLLVDVEMGSCRITTRLDLAINSVQLYLQRCQLGLEPAVTLTADELTALARLGDYQTWVADRRIFVYPENYLDPTLRADVTELFTALQKQLLQADLTSAAAETALLGYLDGLDEIANLEPAAVMREVTESRVSRTESSGQAVVTYTLTLNATHLVSRTRSSPHAYFYRSYSTEQTWTPWEKITVDIDSDNLLPAWLNGQLYVFWTESVDAATEEVPSDPNSGHQPNRSQKLSLAWTRRANGQWAGKQVSPVSLDQGTDTYGIPPANLLLTGDATHAAVYPSDTYGVTAMWFRGQGSVPTQWQVERPGWFTFSPGTLAVDVGENLSHGPQMYPIDTGAPGMLAPSTYYYVVTQIISGFGETGPSQEVHVTNMAPANFLVRWAADASGTYRVYRGPTPGRESIYFEVIGTPDAGQIIFTDSGQLPSGTGTPPPPEGRAIFDVPQSGLTPVGQAMTIGSPGTLTVGLISWSGDPSQRWNGTSSDVLSGLTSVGTRVLASPFQADAADVAPDGARGFLPLYGLFLELGDRSFFAVQDPDIYTIVSTQPASDTTRSSVTTSAGQTNSLAKEISRAFADQAPPSMLAASAPSGQIRFAAAYHPWVKALIQQLRTGRISGLMDRALQTTPGDVVQPPIPAFDFGAYVNGGSTGNDTIVQPYPKDDIDFSPGGMYSTYNWELFFHIPLMIARGLMNNRRFEDARTWLQYIFNPNDTSSNPAPQKYWQTGGLFTYSGEPPDPAVAGLLDLLAGDGADPVSQAAAQKQVTTWLGDPSDPDGLARLRLSAYQKTVVMTYLDNLIAWGDDLFSQGTAETINQATQLYVLAAQLLGPAPDLGTLEQDIQPYSLAELRHKLDEFSDPLVGVENRLAVWTTAPNAPPGFEPAPVASLTPTLYFGVPVNDKLVGYWATVEDRLFKVRHCLDIQGQPAAIPEFGSPVSPGALVAAAFGGARPDGGSPAALPQYRYATLMQKAMELCAEVKALGGALLTAIEKRDAEALARIRSAQEVQVLQAARAVKQRQIDDATAAIISLQRSRLVTYARQQYYLSRPFLNDQETQQIGHLQTAAVLQEIGQGFEVLGAAFALIPQAAIGIAGAAGSPQVNASFGGQQLSEVTQAVSRTLSLLASIESHGANMSGLMGGFQRRQDDWTFQANQAGKELDQIDAQIAGAQIRQDIAQKELANHDLQIANAEAIDAFLIGKFSNPELYEWMIGQISTVYFQAYQLALDTARRAEQAYQHELGIYSTSFIRSGYWNSLSKGLLAGEQLSYDLHRMETSYLENNRREYELTKHISLALIDPVSLLQLRQTGECFIELPEQLFDLDYPGHYLRRIKSVAVTVPCVTGPFGGVNCTLAMMQSRVRLSTDTTSGYAYQSPDPRFSDTLAGSQSIVTSGGQADTGLFETNLRDERYLPFEGAGAISRWQVQLPADTNRLRRDSITDFVLHVRYTARDGGPSLQAAARSAVVDQAYKIGIRLLSLRQNATDRWAQFASWAASGPTDPLTLTLDLNTDLFPSQAPPNIGINQLQLLILTTAALPANAAIGITSPGSASATSVALAPNPALGKIPQGVQAYNSIQPLGNWTISFPTNLASLDATDVVFILQYASE